MIDYELYPIRKQDVDWQLYLLVGLFVRMEHHVKPQEPEIERLARGIEGIDSYDTGFGYQLVFPSEEYTVRYDRWLFGHNAAILKLYFNEYVPVNPFDDEGDYTIECKPMEYFCLLREGDGYAMMHSRSEEISRYPIFVYNGEGFASALEGLARFLERNGLADIQWYERLLLTRRMLAGDANELHILHNAGLYDHQTLWRTLRERGLAEEQAAALERRYVKQLKRYAMYVLNDYNWNSGVPIDEADRNRERGLLIATDWDAYRSRGREEIARRRGLPSNRNGCAPADAATGGDRVTPPELKECGQDGRAADAPKAVTAPPAADSLAEQEEAERRRKAVQDFKDKAALAQKYWGQTSIYHWPDLPPSPREYKGNPIVNTLIVIAIVVLIVALVILLDHAVG